MRFTGEVPVSPGIGAPDASSIGAPDAGSMLGTWRRRGEMYRRWAQGGGDASGDRAREGCVAGEHTAGGRDPGRRGIQDASAAGRGYFAGEQTPG
jgi:hypothetical protein